MGETKAELKLDLLQGTLDLMVLQTLATIGTQHGYGIARRIEQVSGDTVLLNQGTSTPRSCVCSSAVGLTPRGAHRTTTARPSFTQLRKAAENS